MPRFRVVTPSQRLKLLEMMEENKELLRQRDIATPVNVFLLGNLWKKVAINLNEGQDYRKSPTEWRHYWNELKFRSRRSARDYLKFKSGAGPSKRPLNDFEQRVVNVVGLEGFYNMGAKTKKIDEKTNEDAPAPVEQNVPEIPATQEKPTITENSAIQEIPKTTEKLPEAPANPELMDTIQKQKDEAKVILIDEDEEDVLEVSHPSLMKNTPATAASSSKNNVKMIVEDPLLPKPPEGPKITDKKLFLAPPSKINHLQWSKNYAEKRHFLNVRKVQALERISVALEMIADNLSSK